MKKINTKTKLFKPKVLQKITNLNWPQAKVRFPLMKPYKDFDRDGVKNFRDCKPFDIKRQGENDNDEDDEAWEKLSRKKKALAEEGLLDEW